MKTRFLLLCVALLPLMACGDSVGAPTATEPKTEAKAAIPASDADLRIALAKRIPGVRPEDLSKTPVPGIYELVHGTDISYITADGKYVFSGDLFQITGGDNFPNLTDARRRQLAVPQWAPRLVKLAAVPESQMLVFGAANAPHTVTVFTDIDCDFCRRLHAQMADYNKLGIRVRYLFYPRSGPDTEAWYKAEAVWCAKDRAKAFTQAKLDEPIEMKRCPAAPVARDYKLGREFGLIGTPGIVLETGELVPGYLAPKDLLEQIESSVTALAAVKASK